MDKEINYYTSVMRKLHFSEDEISNLEECYNKKDSVEFAEIFTELYNGMKKGLDFMIVVKKTKEIIYSHNINI